MSIMIKKVEYIIPLGVIFKALVDMSDKTLIDVITEKESAFNGLQVIKDVHDRSLFSRQQCLVYLGFLMKEAIGQYGSSLSDEDLGKKFLDDFVLINLSEGWEKCSLLGFMVHKLWRLVQDEILPDNLDSLITQELLTSGTLYGSFLREKLKEYLATVRILFSK